MRQFDNTAPARGMRVMTRPLDTGSRPIAAGSLTACRNYRITVHPVRNSSDQDMKVLSCV